MEHCSNHRQLIFMCFIASASDSMERAILWQVEWFSNEVNQNILVNLGKQAHVFAWEINTTFWNIHVLQVCTHYLMW